MRLNPPTLKPFWFVSKDGMSLDRVTVEEYGKHDDDHRFSVEFRQATVRENELRTGWAARRSFRTDDDGATIQTIERNANVLSRIEVGATLAGTSLQYMGDKGEYVTLEFSESGGIRKIKSDEQFQAWWYALPMDWAQKIYECCVEVNVNWDPKSGLP